MATTTRTWLGGSDNKASNAANWTPNGAPQPGDGLLIRPSQLMVFQSFAMNVSGNDLAGDFVSIGVPLTSGWPLNYTATLTHHAVMNAALMETAGIFNLSQGSSLTLHTQYGYHLGPYASAVINLAGSDHLTLNDEGAPITVNLAAGATWNGTFDAKSGLGPGGMFPSTITVNGQPHASFNNNGASSVTDGSAKIDADVVGHGSFNVVSSGLALARMEFIGAVGSGQSIADAGVVAVDLPKEFAAHVTLKAGGELDLNGLASVDSYTFKNDILSIYAGHSVIDRVHMTDSTAYGFAVNKVGAAIDIVATAGPARVLGNLAVHQG